MEKTTEWFSDEQATFGDRLAGAREAAGLTQEGLSEKLGVELETVIEWEDDLREPRANRVQTLSGMLGVSIGWLLTGEGEGISEPSDNDELDVAPQVADILGEIRAMRAQMRQNVEQLGKLEKKLRRTMIEVQATE
ncbi:helix-turn-helix domain-containing protein [Marivivens aquimaris]|uniref:helix-turn-helix domain-containing protein n=1 Tax=Marivivens aquimaris TaxID=2774876 RepID=UPI001881D69B|nr:helix-turn-helix domain-containing protein [Marivivens aquimaris]